MIRSSLGFLATPQQAAFLKQRRLELHPLIRVNGFRHTKVSKHTLIQDLCDGLCLSIWNWNGITPPCKVVYQHQNLSIPIRCLWEWPTKVNSNDLPWSTCPQVVIFSRSLMRSSFGLLTGLTVIHQTANTTGHPGPIPSLADLLQGFIKP